MRVTDNAFVFSKAEARALLAHASDDETRMHLAGVTLDHAAARAFATDGHRAVVAQARPDSPTASPRKPLVVPREEWTRALKMVPHSGVLVARLGPGTVDDGAPTALAWPERLVALEARSTVNGETHDDGPLLAGIQARAPDVTPPPIMQVIPPINLQDSRVAYCNLNAKYLADLALVAKAADPAGCALRMFAAVDLLSPIVFRCPSKDGATDWIGVVMPIRAGDRDEPAAPILHPEKPALATDDNVVQLPAAAPPADEKKPARKRRSRKVAT